MRVALVLLSATLLLAGCKREAQEAAAQAKGAAADAQRAANEAAARARAAAAEAQRTASDAAAQARSAADQAAATARSAADQARTAADDAAARAHAAADQARVAASSAGDSARQGLDSAGQSIKEIDRRGPARRRARLRRWRRAEHPPALRPGGDAAHRREDPVDPPWRCRRKGGLRQRLHGAGHVHRPQRAAGRDPGRGQAPLSLPVQPPVAPMLSRLVRELPACRRGPLRAEVGRLPDHRLPRRRRRSSWAAGTRSR